MDYILVIFIHSHRRLDRDFHHLVDLLKITKTKAVAECGYDTTDNPNNDDFQKQKCYFEKQLHMAVEGLAVALHCRGDDVLHFKMLESPTQICPINQPIHWHCFTGSQRIFDYATAIFKNIVLGITPFLFSAHYP